MDYDVKMVQNQIKAFNKAYSRAQKADSLTADYYAAINDLIDYDRMTAKSYATAGTKYLESMTVEELYAYSSDIKQAKDLIEFSNFASKMDVMGAKDVKSLLWQMYDKLLDKGYQFDSDLVRTVAEGDTDVDFKEFALQMNKYLNDPDYGFSDVMEWWDSKTGLEE